MEALQKLVDAIDSRLKVIESVIKSIQLPSSWKFDFPVAMNTLVFPLIDKAKNGDTLVVPHGSGAPTGTPTNNGCLYWDYTNSKLYIWKGSWKSITLT